MGKRKEALIRLRRPDCLPDAFRRRWHIYMGNPERRKSIDNRIHDGGEAADIARLSRTLDTERV